MNTIIKKGLVFSLAVALAGCLASCDDTLDEVVYSELTPDNAFVTKDDALAAVNGTYERLIPLTNRAIFYLNDMTTDVCYHAEMDCALLNELKLNANMDVQQVWDCMYQTISRCNIAIDNIPNIPLSEFGVEEEDAKALRDSYIAEAKFMRGFAYYQLTDFFYTVPLVTDSKTPVDAKLAPSSIEDIEMQIDKDLREAKAVLPQKYDSRSDAGRATFSAAAGYLAKLHMRIAGRMRLNGEDGRDEWTTALGYVNEIMALENSVHTLQPRVWDVFNPDDENCKYNNELIFTVHSNPAGTGGTSDIGMNFTPWNYDCGWDLFSIPLELAWKFDREDERYTVLMVTAFPDIYEPENINYTIPESVEKTGAVYEEWKTPEGVTQKLVELGAAYTQKYKYQNALSYNYNTGNNMPLLRFADIVLCKAEILNELNGPTREAIDLVNKIRERAFQNQEHNLKLEDYATTDDLREAICDERAFELNNEGVRRPDLIRMGLWKDRLNKYIAGIKLKSEWQEKNANAQNGGSYDYSSMWKVYPQDLTEDDIRRYFPVPKRESDLNQALLNCRSFVKK